MYRVTSEFGVMKLITQVISLRRLSGSAIKGKVKRFHYIELMFLCWRQQVNVISS